MAGGATGTATPVCSLVLHGLPEFLWVIWRLLSGNKDGVMPKEASGEPTTRRSSEQDKVAAVRMVWMVRSLQAELENI